MFQSLPVFACVGKKGKNKLVQLLGRRQELQLTVWCPSKAVTRRYNSFPACGTYGVRGKEPVVRAKTYLPRQRVPQVDIASTRVDAEEFGAIKKEGWFNAVSNAVPLLVSGADGNYTSAYIFVWGKK